MPITAKFPIIVDARCDVSYAIVFIIDPGIAGEQRYNPCGRRIEGIK